MVETDASDGVLGGVLLQLQPSGEWHPVAYYSKMMIPAEINYPIHDKDMLAIIRALEAWRPELEGSMTRIRIVSDHKALEYFMTRKALSGRQARWAETLSRFNFMLTLVTCYKLQLVSYTVGYTIQFCNKSKQLVLGLRSSWQLV
jgi:hypothetical protein